MNFGHFNNIPVLAVGTKFTGGAKFFAANIGQDVLAIMLISDGSLSDAKCQAACAAAYKGGYKLVMYHNTKDFTEDTNNWMTHSHAGIQEVGAEAHAKFIEAAGCGDGFRKAMLNSTGEVRKLVKQAIGF